MKRQFLFFLILSQYYFGQKVNVFEMKEIPRLDLIEKHSKKNILLFLTSKYCSPCSQLAKHTLTNDTVIRYLSQTFNCFKLSVNDTNRLEISSKFQNSLVPTICILDSSFNLIHKFSGYFDPKQFIQNCEQHKSDKSISNFLTRFNIGERNSEFLYELCAKLELANMLDSNYLNQYWNSVPLVELTSDKNIDFIYHHAVTFFKSNFNSGSKVFKSFSENAHLYHKRFEKENYEQLLIWLLNLEANEYSKQNNYVKFQKTLKYLAPFDNKYEYSYLRNQDNNLIGIVKSLKIISFLEYYFAEENFDDHQKYIALKTYAKKVSKTIMRLDDLVSFLLETYPTNERRLKIARKCIQQSLKIEQNESNELLYARVLLKLGRKKSALKHAHISLKIAQDKTEALQFIKDNSLE